ncbi:MAG: S-layer homology domain-containing protein [Clostridia bacterium]|nr:S-layer homology domain-containing protein [Clostridia bacterium]
MKHILTKSHKLLAGMLALLLCITAVFPLSAAALDTDVPAAQILLSEENGVLKVQLQLRGASLARTQCIALSYDTAALSLLCNDGTKAPITADVIAYDAQSCMTAADGWSAGVMNTVSGKTVPMMEHGSIGDRGLLLLYPTADTPHSFTAFTTVLTLRFACSTANAINSASLRLISYEEQTAINQSVKLMLCTAWDHYTFGSRNGGDTLSAPAFVGHPVINGSAESDSADPVGSWKNPFVDITDDLLYYDAIAYVAQSGLFVGNEKNEFQPRSSMNRATFATVLCRLAGAEAEAIAAERTASDFTDVTVKDWFAPYVAWAVKEGLFYGYGNGKFGPNDPITHEQMYLLMQRFTEMYGFSVKDGANVSLASLADSEKIDSWAVDAVKFAYANDLLVVDANKTIRPLEAAARWELAVLLQSLSEIPRTVITASASLTDAYAAGITASEVTRGAVDTIANGLLTLSDKIDLSAYHLTLEQLTAVYQEAVKRPEFFYVGNRYSYSINSRTNEILSITPEYTMRGTALSNAQKQYNAGLNDILSGVDAKWSDLEKLLYLHDQLAVRYTYDNTYSYFDAYHLLTEGRAVCQGYTMLLQALLNAVGIENDTVISGQMNHTWNLVRLNGSWYHVDVTWADPVPEQYGQAIHTYFLKSDTYMLQAEDPHYGWSSFEDIACTDTTYDDAFFNDIRTPFVNASDGNWYYIDNVSGTICRWDPADNTQTSVYTTGIRWTAPQGYFVDKFTGLAALGDMLLYNNANGIYAYNLDTQTSETVHLRTGSGYIFGMTLRWSSDASGNAVPYIYYQVKGGPNEQSNEMYYISAANLLTYTVRGTVSGYFSDAQTKITLLRNGTAYKSITLPRGDSFLETELTFVLDGVRTGLYDLVIEKKGCLTQTVKSVQISQTTDLTSLFGALTLLCGDVNADGKINGTDTALLLGAGTFRRAKDKAAAPAADCNGDGIIDIVDYAIMTDVDRYGTSA